MATTQTVLFPPPLRALIAAAAGTLSDAFRKWFLTLQNLHPLNLVDTSGGSYSEATPPAGLNSTTGQSNQNQEIVYKKTSSDGNTFTLTGVADGSQTLTAQYSKVRIKSDGTQWWVV